ncbi:hypothetical protein KUTeg_008973 [Tegillarca granosa]|uniref:E3 ubiquitin-protein ligase n=1 Tax=Tegillarca granosa TaxID=220873 RepID=A0ABQ9F7X7_TEGGR|nr:hypothetical protein KUTeg_008973 [Tegillarca granosa]
MAKVHNQQRTWSSKPTTLKEIHFIDMNIEMCKQIADVFSKCGDFKEAGLSVGSKPSNISTSSRHSFSHSSYSRSLSNSSFDRNDDEAYSSSVEMLFRLCSWITIHLLQSSITDIKKVSAVVSPENLGFKHQGRISKAILDKADEDFRDKVEVMKDRPTSITSVFSVDCSKEMPWKCVLYSIAPRLDSKYKQNIQQFETDLKDTVVNILSEAAIKGLESLAIPLLGTAVSGMKTPMDSCCHAMLDGIWSIINRGTRKKNWKLDLWIVTTDQDAIHTFEKMLNTKTGSKLTNTNPDFGSSKVENQKTDDNTLDEDCCICMDKITDPKWLPCKHVFCTDCIDQQFKFKPACPQCGAVHGIVTGDQPPGSMSRIKQNFSLPGYPECKTIAITYTFSSGYQTEEHPNPGKFYSGIERTGYLPDNEKAKLLRVAFDRRLVFTIGRSRTTGQEGVITWNDIHHKTRTHGGQQSFGYPDDTYLDRVLDELAAKGKPYMSI